MGLGLCEEWGRLCLGINMVFYVCSWFSYNLELEPESWVSGADPGGGGVLGVRPPPSLFGGPPNFKKRKKKRCMNAGMNTVRFST